MVGRSKIVEISRNMPSAEAVGNDFEPLELAETSFQPDVDVAATEIPQPAYVVQNDEHAEQWDDADESKTRKNWSAILVGTALITAFIGWTAFWGWANQTELLGPSAPARIAELIGLWAIPACLIALGWLLAMRLSTREAGRFSDVAALLRVESEALETRMRTVNGEITLARAFLAENARELESVGRSSAQRMTEAGEQLAAALSRVRRQKSDARTGQFGGGAKCRIVAQPSAGGDELGQGCDQRNRQRR